MKVSLKLQDDHHHKNHRQPPLLLRAKIPISIFDFPFLSHFSTTTSHPSDLSLSLSTNFRRGPSLKLSYATAAAASPLTLSLKSGTGLFGSPQNSPLVISADFSFNPSNLSNNPNPTFSLLFKPQLGSFSLRKSVFSEPRGGSREIGDVGRDKNSFGFVPLERDEGVKERFLVEKVDERDSTVYKGIRMAARTEMPVARGVAMDFRWWVNFADDRMPVLRINKIGIRRVDDDDVVKRDGEVKKEKGEGKAGEVEVLKSMCVWMKRELDDLTRVNREMKCDLEEIKHLGRNGGGDFRHGVRKKTVDRPSVERPSGGFEQWRSKKNGCGEDNVVLNGKKEEKKDNSLAIDVESELQRAIKAAVSSP